MTPASSSSGRRPPAPSRSQAAGARAATPPAAGGVRALPASRRASAPRRATEERDRTAVDRTVRDRTVRDRTVHDRQRASHERSRAARDQDDAPRDGGPRTIEAGGSRERRLAGLWDSPVLSYYLVTGTTALLLVIGLVMVLSSSSVDALAAHRSEYGVFFNQTKFAAVGAVLLIGASHLTRRFYKHVATLLLGLSFLFQLLIFTPLARSQGGNQNWIAIPGVGTVQPSEFIKVTLALWLGVVLAQRYERLHVGREILWPAGVGIVLALGLVMAGHDLGTALVMIVMCAGALFVAGVPLRYFGFGALVAAAGVAAFVIPSTNRRARITSWLGGGGGESSLDYETLHGLWGLGTGGISGVGLGAGRQKWSYLPAAPNDFIYSVIGEELGLVGTVGVLVLFAILGAAMVRIIRRHPDPMVKIATAAIGCWVVGQALINIGVVIGLLPVMGVPLPLVSAGGSSLIATMIALGAVISFARDEPGAREALAARPGVVRRSVAVVGRVGGRRGGGTKGTTTRTRTGRGGR